MTNALGIGYCAFRWDALCLGAGVFRLTGYQEEPIYVPVPIISYEQKIYAIDAIAGIKDRKWVVGVALRLPVSFFEQP